MIFLGEVRAGDVFLGFISISVVIKTMLMSNVTNTSGRYAE